MLNRLIVIFLAYIMYGCTSEVISSDGIEDSMVLPKKVVSGWSASGSLTAGKGVTLQTPEFEKAGNYTVQFDVQLNNGVVLLSDPVQLRAEISWFVEGNSVQRIVDVGNGVSVSGMAQKITVKVYNDSTIVLGGSVTELAVVSILVVEGIRPAVEKPPTYLLNRATIAPNASTTITLPADVGATSVLVNISPTVIGTAIGAYDVLVEQVGDTGGTPVLSSYDPRQESWMPIAVGTKAFKISTSAAAPSLVATTILGVDG
jgi:hypothetical protein